MNARFNPRLPVNMKTIGSARIWQLSFERFVQEVDLGFVDRGFLLSTLMTLLSGAGNDDEHAMKIRLIYVFQMMIMNMTTVMIATS